MTSHEDRAYLRCLGQGISATQIGMRSLLLKLMIAFSVQILLSPKSSVVAGRFKDSLVSPVYINFSPSLRSKGACGILIAQVKGRHEFTQVKIRGRRVRAILHRNILSDADLTRLPFDPNTRTLKHSKHVLYIYAVTLPGLRNGLKTSLVSDRLLELSGYYVLARAPKKLALWHLGVWIPDFFKSQWVLVPLDEKLEVELENRLYEQFTRSLKLKVGD